jgi:hypothetical protein
MSREGALPISNCMAPLWRFKKFCSHETAQRPKKEPIMKAGNQENFLGFLIS